MSIRNLPAWLRGLIGFLSGIPISFVLAYLVGRLEFQGAGQCIQVTPHLSAWCEAYPLDEQGFMVFLAPICVLLGTAGASVTALCLRKLDSEKTDSNKNLGKEIDYFLWIGLSTLLSFITYTFTSNWFLDHFS